MDTYYEPYSERISDTQYRDILDHILMFGHETHNQYQTTARITSLTTPNMYFDLENGFPMITERDVGSFWRKPIAELIAFMHGARTIEDLKKYGGPHWANWWKKWVSKEKCADFGLEEGDLGPGSYGPGFVRQQPDGSVFNQFAEVAQQIVDTPWATTHKITAWIPELTIQNKERKRKVVVAPCHGDIQITLLGERLVLRMDQRSGDMPIGVPSNMIQYAALTLMFAQVTGKIPHMYIHSVHDAHMYENQVEKVKELIRRQPVRFPTVRITDPSIKDILDFRAEHFELEDYHPHPAMNDIPVTE